MKLIIPIGLPGCGKTTNRPDDCYILSKDEIRFMLFDYPAKDNQYEEMFEPIIDEIDRFIFTKLVERGLNIYIDETNLKGYKRRWYEELALREGYEFHLVWYANDNDALRRNRERKRRVPEHVMEDMISYRDPISDWEIERCKTIEVIYDA